MHRNHPNGFANFKIMIMSFIAMLPVSRSPFSAWSDRCLTFFSLVRHVSQLGETHVSPFSIPDSNTDFEFATGRTLQPVHLVCIPSGISLFCIDPDDFREIVCVVFFILRFRAISELNDKIILKTVVWILF